MPLVEVTGRRGEPRDSGLAKFTVVFSVRDGDFVTAQLHSERRTCTTIFPVYSLYGEDRKPVHEFRTAGYVSVITAWFLDQTDSDVT